MLFVALLALRLCCVWTKLAAGARGSEGAGAGELNAINNSLNKYKSKWMSHSTKGSRRAGGQQLAKGERDRDPFGRDGGWAGRRGALKRMADVKCTN